MRWGSRIVGLIAVLAMPSQAMAATAATGTLAKAGDNRYTLTVANTGDQPIQCMRFTAAAGVTVSNVSGAGTITPTGTTGWGAQGFTIAPGASGTWSFSTSAPYPDNAGGQLDVSSTCQAGSDVSVQATGPPPAAGPPAAACKCSRLRAFFDKLSRNAANRRRVDLYVDWTLECTPGTGGCAGEVEVAAFPRATATEVRTIPTTERFGPGNSTIRCRSDSCQARKTVQSRVRFTLGARDAARLGPGRPLRVRLRSFCLDGGQKRRTHQITITLAFNRNGSFNRRASDTNGDGRRDDGRRGRPGG